MMIHFVEAIVHGFLWIFEHLHLAKVELPKYFLVPKFWNTSLNLDLVRCVSYWIACLIHLGI